MLIPNGNLAKNEYQPTNINTPTRVDIILWKIEILLCSRYEQTWSNVDC
jgi:hypothetical protein